MRFRIIIVTTVLLLAFSKINADDFIRNLPKPEMLKEITPEKYPNDDAVIILKEQSYQIQYKFFQIRDADIFGPGTMYTKIMIVKLFNESAVKRYGSFEFEYIEKFGNKLKNYVEARARVLKENGDIEVLDEDEIENFVSRKDEHGEPLTRKVLFKIPNLKPGDVLQIEYQYDEVLAFSPSKIFYYNDLDYVLFSNLYITLPYDKKFNVFSSPQEKVGEPQIQQISEKVFAGKTYFWSVRNLDPIPDEVYSKPFESSSRYTAFTITGDDNNDMNLWGDLADRFYENYLKDGEITSKQYGKLGLKELSETDPIDFKKTDSLYSAIKKYFTSVKFNSVFPVNNDLDDLFESKKGDASDLAIVMYNILKKWKQDIKIAWIRDLREGDFDINIPAISWFNRLGVLVKIDGKEKFYDFDRCIANNFKTPWFLSGIKVMVIDKDYSYEKKLPELSDLNNNYISENHTLIFNGSSELTDSLVVNYNGSKAESYRDEIYDLEENEIKDKIKEKFVTASLKEINNFSLNNFYAEDSIKICMSGFASTKPEVVDSFVVFKLNSNVIKRFKDLISTNLRRSDFQFESPFSLKTTWEITLPNGYKLKDPLPGKTLYCPVNAFTQIDCKRENNKLKITAVLTLRDRVVPAKSYNDLISLFDRTIKAIEKEIILKKI